MGGKGSTTKHESRRQEHRHGLAFELRDPGSRLGVASGLALAVAVRIPTCLTQLIALNRCPRSVRLTVVAVASTMVSPPRCMLFPTAMIAVAGRFPVVDNASISTAVALVPLLQLPLLLLPLRQVL